MVSSERLYRGAGRPAVIRKRDKSLTARASQTKPRKSKVVTTYGNTLSGIAYEASLFEQFVLHSPYKGRNK